MEKESTRKKLSRLLALFFYLHSRSFLTGHLFCLGFLGHFFETINTTGGVNNLLLASVEWVTEGADFRVHDGNR